MIVFSIVYIDVKKRVERIGMEKIRYGIISTAKIVPRFVAGINESEYSYAYAIGSRDIAKAKTYSERLNIPHYYGSYREVYEDPKVDIVYIATYNGGHYQCILDALEHSKHVLCEKPLCLTAKQVQEVFLLAKEKNLFLMEAQKAAFLPVTMEIKKRLQSGDIGEVQWINIINSHISHKRGEWFKSIEKGGGTLWGGGSYPLEFLMVVFEQKLNQVSGALSIVPPEPDNGAVLNLKMKENILASIFVTKDIQKNSRAEIYGSKGRLIIPNYWKTNQYVVEKDGEHFKKELPMQSEFVYEIDLVNELLRSKKTVSPIMTPEITFSAISIIEGVYRQELGEDRKI
ncbi:Gfo/Idh/MocA family protein [Tetragenococcus halophilus]|uniref:Gfo/Idh/MocA family protein n=1 Tax=Tetragenococcus halophilus TaxID=51669 RepID=UPI00256B0756|nr:Gfo/Idh/MocA family oxidoreductase [Tetragenococcus halophilus]GMG67005.1 Gfo/Idh/MocA family oxidoreductase [Tetragenococcus halophilus]